MVTTPLPSSSRSSEWVKKKKQLSAFCCDVIFYSLSVLRCSPFCHVSVIVAPFFVDIFFTRSRIVHCACVGLCVYFCVGTSHPLNPIRTWRQEHVALLLLSPIITSFLNYFLQYDVDTVTESVRAGLERSLLFLVLRWLTCSGSGSGGKRLDERGLNCAA